jgi:hypothetical protein
LVKRSWSVSSFSVGTEYTGVFKCPHRKEIIEVRTLLDCTTKTNCLLIYSDISFRCGGTHSRSLSRHFCIHAV